MGSRPSSAFGRTGWIPVAFGWGGAYGTNYRVDPQSGITMVLMIQLIPNPDIQE